MISNLLIAADNDVQKAERGIIYIDEIDKLARKAEGVSSTRDVSGEGVQQALLKIIEGTVANVIPRGAKKFGQSETTQINTGNILVICGAVLSDWKKSYGAEREPRVWALVPSRQRIGDRLENYCENFALKI